MPRAVLCAALAAAPAARAGAAPRVDPPALPAAGRGAARLAVDAPGRYALTVASPAGASLQLVDRETGPGPLDGEPGGRDGRLDLLLDRGDYRLVIRGPEGAPGEAALAARAFTERHATPPVLTEGRPAAVELADLEQASWWLEVPAARRVVVEAAGRCLADLRLWRDGGWLVDAAPAAAVVEPEPGRPLRSRVIAARLEPGRYLLTAYGGPAEPWAAGGDAHPLHLRLGIPELPAAGRARLVAGPFGADHWVVPAGVNFVRIDLPASAPAVLETRPYDAAGDPFLPGPAVAEVTKQSREPFAELLDDGAAGAPRLVTVRARPGQPFLLQHFEVRDRYPLRASGRHWIGTIHAGHPGDAADATAVVLRTDAAGKRDREPFLVQAVEVGEDRGWARRFPLPGPTSVVVRATAARTYEVLLRGAPARARIVPWLAERPEGFAEPPWQGSGGRWRLEKGLHELQIEPAGPGVVEAALRPAGRLDRIFDALDPDRPVRGEPVRAAVTFPDAALDWGRTYEVRPGRRPGVRSGLVLRALPIDLAQPLPLALRPGEEVDVPVAAAETGALAAVTDDGGTLEVSVKGGPWGTSVRLGPGRHQVLVRSRAAATAWASLRFAPDRPAPAAPAPAAPQPELPVLAEGEPRFLDLPRGGTATFALRADGPAFALVESTGLLATAGTLRTRLEPALAHEAGGGSGRNFAIGRYLRAGEYLLTVAALGESAGHLGVRLRRAPVREGGSLREGVPARDEVAAGEGIAYDLTVPERGEYRIECSALGRPLAARVEDAEGWPVAPHGEPLAGATLELEAGRHRVILPPEPLGSRRVTLLSRVEQPATTAGHGPHLLALGATAEHLWLEPPEGGERVPDRWAFTLPGPARLTVTLTGEMEGTIAPRDGAGAGAAAPVRLHPGRPWTGELPAGDYRLDAVCSRRNNRAPYRVSVLPAELLAGLARRVDAPAAVPVSVGTAGLYEIATSGPGDVSVRLFDARGALVAEQEDRPGDWNVQLVLPLEPGTYRLAVAPTGAARAETTVSLRALAEYPPGPPATLPLRWETHPGDGVVVLPLALTGSGKVFVLRVAAEEAIGASLERRAGDSREVLWSGAGRRLGLEMPLGDGGDEAARYVLRLWSLDRRGGPVAVDAVAVAPPEADEEEIARGVAVAPVAGIEPPVALLALDPDRPGIFAGGDGGGRRWSGRPLEPATPLGPEGAAATAGPLLLVADLPAGAARTTLRAARVALDGGAPAPLRLPSAGAIACDLAPAGPGPVLVTVAGVGGQPGVALVPAKDAGRGRLPAAAAAPGDGSAAALLPAPPRAVAAVLWRADDAAGPLPATVRVRTFPEPRPRPLAGGLAAGTVGAGEAAAVDLPRGPSRVRVTLAGGLAAALSRDGRVEAAFDASAAPADEAVEGSADRLTVVNPGAAPGAWSVEVIPLAGRERTVAVSPGWPFLTGFARAGTLRVPVAAEEGAPRTLHVRGADGEPVLLGNDGGVRRGDGLRVGSGGTLLLRHRPGTLVAWTEDPRAPLPGLWGDGRPAEERTLAPPEGIALRGVSIRLRAKADRPSVLHLRAPLPVVTLVRRPGGQPEAGVQLDGARIDLPLAPGVTEVWLRAADGGDLRGRAEATLSPVTPIGEGPGPDSILAAGAARFYSFRVERGGPVGVGVRADPDAAECLLLDAQGRAVGSGPVQMPTLAPGDYLLAVRAPEGGGPLRVRPALAGIAPPPSGPPEDVIRRYLSGDAAGAAADLTGGPADNGEDEGGEEGE